MNDQFSSSFRDPSGYIFLDKGIFKRKILPPYFETYGALKSTDFFQPLFNAKLLIPHQEISESNTEIVLIPEQIPFITYPYEWSFNQYKEAALLTLKLQKYSLQQNFTLKDASAFNVTLQNGKAIFIDTLSFETYDQDKPWRAYRQFVNHFLGPLLLAHYHGAHLLKFISNFTDGIPVKILASMLPFKSKFSPFIYSNVHLLAKFEEKHNEDYEGNTRKIKLSKKSQLKIIESLYNFIKELTLKEQSEWGNYYHKINYSNQAFEQKATIINSWISDVNARTLIDIGGNDGTFVRKIIQPIEQALIGDIDANAVDFNFKTIRQNSETHITPFLLDVLNPSANIGFNNDERFSFLHRISKFAPDITLALALIHHISLSGNVPFDKSAQFFSTFSKYLIIEFPEKEDSWVQRLLKSKMDFKDYFEFYNQSNFEKAYFCYFDIVEKFQIENTHRTMYLLKKK